MIYSRRFGCEFEFSSPFDDIEKVLKTIIPKNKLKAEKTWYLSSKNKQWHLKTDATTESELATPISTLKDLPKIKKILDALKEAKISITQADSTHMHIETKDVPKHNIITAWIQIEKAILKCLPKHRRNNTYCQKLIQPHQNDIARFLMKAENVAQEHHSILSLYYYDERKTIEFRGCEGSYDIKTVENWLKFYMNFLNYAKKIDPVQIICDSHQIKTSLIDVMNLLQIKDKHIVDFLDERGTRFKH